MCNLQVTNLVEKGRKKCEEYWSDTKPQSYGNTTVECLGIVSFPDYKVRKLSDTQVCLHCDVSTSVYLGQ